MGMGLNQETQDEIQRIQVDPNNDPKDGANAPESERPQKKRKTRTTLTSDVWKHLKKGHDQEDGSYDAICNYCRQVFKMGCQRSTSSLRHHITKSCKKIPHNIRHKPDAM
jgi:hypothetical protein